MDRKSRNRVAFAMLYNGKTSKVVQLTANGYTAQEIENKTDIPRTSVAAIKANLTRGSYAPFAYSDYWGNIRGTCRY